MGAAQDWNYRGHVKYQLRHTQYDSNTIPAQAGAEQTTDQDINFRFIAENRWDKWDVKAHYELIGIYSDSLEAAKRLQASPLLSAFGLLPDDDRRLFDLTRVISESGKRALVHRLDRLSVGYTARQYVLRIGRHVVSWGNGLLYNPMDFFNPFDPTTVDKDYKTGDDMLYGQYLFESGNDLQGVLVPRRDPDTGQTGSDKGSLAFKYHGFMDSKEYDMLAARHYGDNLGGLGTAADWQGAVIRGDLLVTDTQDDTVLSAVANISYSWTWWDKNVSGLLEYFYNGFGQKNGDYEPQSLLANQELLQRIARGELFTLGRNYLAGSLTIEATPLVQLLPTVFINLDDPSALLQFTTNYDWRQNITLLAGVNLPMGPQGTEFGGIPTAQPNVFIGSGESAFAKVSYFF